MNCTGRTVCCKSQYFNILLFLQWSFTWNPMFKHNLQIHVVNVSIGLKVFNLYFHSKKFLNYLQPNKTSQLKLFIIHINLICIIQSRFILAYNKILLIWNYIYTFNGQNHLKSIDGRVWTLDSSPTSKWLNYRVVF